MGIPNKLLVMDHDFEALLYSDSVLYGIERFGYIRDGFSSDESAGKAYPGVCDRYGSNLSIGFPNCDTSIYIPDIFVHFATCYKVDELCYFEEEIVVIACNFDNLECPRGESCCGTTFACR